MHVISTSDQTIKCIPRDSSLSVDLVLRNEQTRSEESKSIVGTTVGNYTQFDLDFTPKEGSSYSFKITNGGDLLYYGMAFCTDQTDPNAYKTTNGAYTEVSTNNEYIFNE